MTNKILYHGNCYDGFGAAYAAWKHFGDEAEYYPMYYGQELPIIYGGDQVFLLDYSRSTDDLIAISSKAKLEIHDHHKSAVPQVEQALETLEFHGTTFTAVMDMDKSGAVLAWERFHPDKPVPLILKNIMDRDLWRFNLSGSKAIHAYLCAKPFDFKIWDQIVTNGNDPRHYDKMIEDGELILEYHDRLVDLFCEQAELITMDGHQVPCVNISMLFSEVPHKLLELYPDAPFSAYRYFRKGCIVQFGLRGRGDFDVSEVAKKFGGGGHKSSAGFEVEEGLFYQSA